jgi:hypothetical protein
VTSTSHYSIVYVEQNQSGKYITVNQAFDTIDTALNSLASGGSITLAGDVTGAVGTNTVTKLRNRTVAATAPSNGYVLTWNNGATQWEPAAPAATDLSAYAPLASPTFTGTPAAPTASAATSTTQLATTAFVTTADALKANLASPTFTGTVTAANLTVSGTLTATFAHDLAAFHPGVPTASAVLLRHVAVRAWSLPTNAVGSALSAGTAATGSTTITLAKNGVGIGTAVVSAAGTTAAFTVTSTSFAALDVFTATAPASADATLANVAISFLGTR